MDIDILFSQKRNDYPFTVAKEFSNGGKDENKNIYAHNCRDNAKYYYEDKNVLQNV